MDPGPCTGFGNLGIISMNQMMNPTGGKDIGKGIINLSVISVIKIIYLWCFSFTYYEEGGPIFIQIDGEWESSSAGLSYGAWLDWARKEKAALFVLEHRYYGKSRPTDKITTEELQWLSSRWLFKYLLAKNAYG